ncbi:hypothetical protein [Sciscionella sediminilitoris]|uniref:hypothetical protein n=1 Tax=Sciscionella sediminilitoris TaxID=1445613 RepID=UPI0004DF0E5F|nr:hypothetical protein [Sciscionella sp. SE31]
MNQHGDYPRSGYGGLGYFSPAPQPPKRGRGKVLVLSALGLVVVLAAVLIPLLLLNSGDSREQAAPSSAPASASLPAPPSVKTDGLTAKDVSVPAVTGDKGWQGVKDLREKTAYDVPPGWKVEKPGLLTGYQSKDGKHILSGHAVSTYKSGYCLDDAHVSRGFVAWKTVSRSVDKDMAVRNLATNLVTLAASDKNTLPHMPTPQVTATTVYGGKPARMAKVSAVPISQQCGAPKRTAIAVGFTANIGNVVVLICYDEGVPDAPAQGDIDRIIASLRDAA